MSPLLASTITTAWFALLGLLSAYGAHRLFLIALYLRHRKRPPRPGVLPRDLPVVTVQLPVFNEATVVERLVDAACALDWPRDRLEVQVLDDSTDETTALARQAAARGRARGVDVQVLRRPERHGFKAGALAWHMARARGEFLAIFDADFVPKPDYLRRVMPYFYGDPAAGMVQARWGHLNADQNLLTRLSSILLDGHFVIEHTARNRSGRFFNFNGTAGTWRRTCIEAAGGWQHDTLTEDLDLSYRAQLAGWSFIYLCDLVVPAEIPAQMAAFKAQQHRWAKGTAQVLRKLAGRLLRAPIPWPVRLEAMIHLTGNIGYPLVLALALLLPPAIAARGHGPPIRMLVDLPAFLLATGSVAVFYALAEHEAGRLRGRDLWRLPLLMALGIGISINQTRAVIEGLFDHDTTFVRTPKQGSDANRYRARRGWTLWAEIAVGAYLTAATIWAFFSGYWASVPFLVLFAGGFLYVGLTSLWENGRSAHRAHRQWQPTRAIG